MERIYLDYNATAPLHEDAKKAMLEVMEQPLNASSIHADGRAARKILEDARSKILKFVNAKNLVFCGSGTEANNFALAQVMSFRVAEFQSFISAIEHDSVSKAAINPIIIGVDKNGIINLEELTQQLSNSATPKLVSIMLANNETGVIQPIKEAAKIAHEFGALIHTDAVQAFGKMEIDFENLGVDMMTISAHKIGGPVGAASLVYKNGLELKPFLRGGGQEKNKRAGTENIAAIAGFAAMTEFQVSSFKFQEYLEKEIRKISPAAIIHSENAERLTNTTLVSVPNMDAATQLIAFDMEGISVSSGAACSSGRVEKSRVLTAMDAKFAENAIRISTGWNTTKKDIEKFLAVWKKLSQKN